MAGGGVDTSPPHSLISRSHRAWPDPVTRITARRARGRIVVEGAGPVNLWQMKPHRVGKTDMYAQKLYKIMSAPHTNLEDETVQTEWNDRDTDIVIQYRIDKKLGLEDESELSDD